MMLCNCFVMFCSKELCDGDAFASSPQYLLPVPSLPNKSTNGEGQARAQKPEATGQSSIRLITRFTGPEELVKTPMYSKHA